MQKLLTILLLTLTLHTISANGQKTIEKIEDNEFIVDSSFKELAQKNITKIFAGKKPISVKGLSTILKEDSFPKLNKSNFNKFTEKEKEQKSPIQIYNELKSKVFLVGVYSTYSKSTSKVDIIASAYSIQKNGLFLTNYHVLKPIIEHQISNKVSDSMYYFIESIDGEIYFIDNIFNYDLVNDISVFSVKNNSKSFNVIPIGDPAKVGESIFCLSNPENNFYFFSQGNVTRNYIKPFISNGVTSNKYIMGISADYAGGSSGSPIVDNYGNLVGMVSSTLGIFTGPNGHGQLQMVLKNAVHIYPIKQLLK